MSLLLRLDKDAHSRIATLLRARDSGTSGSCRPGFPSTDHFRSAWPAAVLILLSCLPAQPVSAAVTSEATNLVELKADAGGKRFNGIGVVNGGGATSVLLKDYPEPQRGQILDLVYKPKFGASASALLVKIPGDGNATRLDAQSHAYARRLQLFPRLRMRCLHLHISHARHDIISKH
jgi:hypothetical protein